MPNLRKLTIGFGLVAVTSIGLWIGQGRSIIGENRGQDALSSLRSTRTPAALTEETFRFKKAVHVTFDFNDEVVKHEFTGELYLDWMTERGGRVATVSVRMPGLDENLHVRARFTEDHLLKCMEAPVVTTEKESDVVLLLKNLVLDYAFLSTKDDNGMYEARFEDDVKDDGTRLITKKKLRYLGPGKEGLTVVKALHEVVLDESLKNAKGEEQLELLFEAPDKIARVRTSYELQRIANGDRTARNETLAFGACSNDFSHAPAPVAKVSPGEFQDAISGLTNLGRSERHDSMRKILKAIRANPELLTELMEWISNVKADRKLSALAVGMLGNLGTPAAQRELVNLFTNATEETKHLHHQVLNAFTLTQGALTFESRQFLKAQMSGDAPQLAEGAAYALGTSIQNDPESEESHRDLSFLMYGLEQSTSVKSKLIYLDALGNSGSPEAIATFEKYAASNEELIRRKAQELLRVALAK